MMSNANTPTHPLKLNERVEDTATGHMMINECDDYFTGLTKREHFAGLAMQGLLSNSVMGDSDLHDNHQEWLEDITDASVKFADKLLKQLGEQNEQD